MSRAVAFAGVGLGVLLVSAALHAHGEHPHPPGAADSHGPDADPPPPAPTGVEVVSETLPTDPADAAPPAAPSAPAAVAATPDLEGQPRPRTIQDNSWRQRIRDHDEDSESAMTDFGHFYFELRFGPYSPKVDDEPGLTGTPYADFFGTGPQFYFGLELDWLPLYIPYVASIGPGFGWGFTSASANAKVEGTGEDAGSETSLTIFPMHLSAVVRVDGPLRELNIPIVPYVKVGLGFGLWSASGPSSEDEGSSYGMHLAIGGALALNAFDRSAAMAMREETGIRYANIYGEWMFDNLGTIGSDNQMYIGTSTAIFGIALDF